MLCDSKQPTAYMYMGPIRQKHHVHCPPGSCRLDGAWFLAVTVKLAAAAIAAAAAACRVAPSFDHGCVLLLLLLLKPSSLHSRFSRVTA